MLNLLAIGPLELVILGGVALLVPLSYYLTYRMGYRVGNAEGALQQRDRST